MMIAPVFDSTGRIVFDPSGTLLNANIPGKRSEQMTFANRLIAPVFDATGRIVSDPTGTILGEVNP
jgi:hypothetical protein